MIYTAFYNNAYIKQHKDNILSLVWKSLWL